MSIPSHHSQYYETYETRRHPNRNPYSIRTVLCQLNAALANGTSEGGRRPPPHPPRLPGLLAGPRPLLQ